MQDNSINIFKDNLDFLKLSGSLTEAEAEQIYAVDSNTDICREPGGEEKGGESPGRPVENAFFIGIGSGEAVESALEYSPGLRNICIIEIDAVKYCVLLKRIDLKKYPGVNWFLWLGDVSMENIRNKLNAFYTAVGAGTPETTVNREFQEQNPGFMERYNHMLRIMNNYDRIEKIANRVVMGEEMIISPVYFIQMYKDVMFPVYIRIEPTNFCNIKCSICPTHGIPKSEKGFMSMELYTMILESLEADCWKSLRYIYLYLGGESLMHKNICEMIEMAATAGHITHLNTNSTLLKDDLIERIISSGLRYIHFSFDDVEPERFNEYRRGSDYWKVYEKIKRFVEIKESMGSKTPEVKIAAMRIPGKPGEESTIPASSEKFLSLFEGMPVDIKPYWTHHWASDFSAGLTEMQSLSKIEDYYPCKMLWHEISIRWDGTIVPCCYDLRSEMPMGKFPDRGLNEIWNGPEYSALRQKHLFGRVNDEPLCAGCSALLNTDTMDGILGADASFYKKKALS